MSDQENPETTLDLSKDDDAIAANWEEIQTKYAVEEETPEPVKAERPRDETGKFAKAEPKSEAAPEAVKAPVEPSPVAAQTEAPPAETKPEDTALAIPPSSWKPAAKAAWGTLPAEIRAEIVRREGDMLKGQGQLLPDATFGKNMRSVVAPYEQIIAQAGSTPERAIQNLLRSAAILRTGSDADKQNALLSIANEYGIPLPGAIGQDGNPHQFNPATFRDPRVDEMLANQEAQKTASIEQAIDKFTNELDAKGQPLRPYLSNVDAEMMALIPQIRQSNPGLSHAELLQQAYDRAVWANPETRALLEKQRFDELEAKRREENLRVVSEAKKAASVNVPRRGFTNKTPVKQSMEQTIEGLARESGWINN